MIPSDLRKEAIDLQKNIDWADDGAEGKKSNNANHQIQ
jgi:hypothetical protein